VAELLLEGKGIDMPPLHGVAEMNTTFKKAPKARRIGAETPPLPLDRGK
jgi:hypothetical protein